MSQNVLLAKLPLLIMNFLLSNAGRTHYYGGSGYPSAYSGYNGYYSPYSSIGAYGLNPYGSTGYYGSDNYDGYNDEDYDVDHSEYGSYGHYQSPYIGNPVIKKYVAPVTKSVSTSSLYQTHPTGYGGYHGYAGASGYGYGPQYGSGYATGYYKK